MTPEIGKFYRAADGRKVGPIKVSDWERYPLEAEFPDHADAAYYRADGTCPYLPEFNLVEEWSA